MLQDMLLRDLIFNAITGIKNRQTLRYILREILLQENGCKLRYFTGFFFWKISTFTVKNPVIYRNLQEIPCSLQDYFYASIQSDLALTKTWKQSLAIEIFPGFNLL